MNPDNSTDPRQALEPSLTALLLGELTDEQARFLRQAIATDPELAKTFERIKKTTELIRETERKTIEEPKTEPEPLKLSDSRRQELLQRFKTVQPEQFKREKGRRYSWLPVAAAAALIMLLAAALLPSLSGSKSRYMAQRRGLRPEYVFQRKLSPVERIVEARKSTDVNSIGASGALKSTESLQRPALNGETAVQYSIAPGDTTAGYAQAVPPAAAAQTIFLPAGGKPETVTLSVNETPTAALSFGVDAQPQSLARARAAGGRQAAFDTFSGGGGLGGSAPAPTTQQVPLLGDTPLLGREFSRSKTDEAAILGKTESESTPSLSLSDENLATTRLLERSADSLNGQSTSDNYYSLLPGQKAADPAGLAQLSDSKKKSDRSDLDLLGAMVNQPASAEPQALAFRSRLGLQAEKPEAEVWQKSATLRGFYDDKTKFRELEESKDKSGKELAKNERVAVKGLFEGKEQDREKAQTKAALTEKLAEEPKGNIADLGLAKQTPPAPIPQPEIPTRDNAFSTFSLNVSDVSFRLAAASLEQGKMPSPDSIRSEEFINAFDYRDPEPTAGAAVGFAWDRAGDPFAQNRDLLRFSVKTAAAGRQGGKPLNIVLLLDNSGSMERADRVRIIHEALRVLATQLQASDTLSMVAFARTARLWVDGVSGDQAGRIADELGGLTPQGGTNLEEAMNLAYQTALRHYSANGINRVVLLTDGAANLGDTDPEVLKKKVETNRKQGIALDCFGIGWEGYNDDLLEVLTRNGDGRYGFLNTPEEAATDFAGQLAGALHVAAADVKVQVEFNPNRVTSYRQIGYARHQLTKEQFRDNTVDAAEIGAAESGNAVYTIESNPQGQGPIALVRVRYKVPGTADYQEHEWTVPYAGNAAPLEQSSTAMRLAATAAGFSEWLASSPYATEITPDKLVGYLNGVPSVYGADPRPQKLEWMIRQAKAISGK